MLKIAEKLSTLPPVTVYEPEYVPRPPKLDTSAPLNITVDDNTYIVEGPWLERLMANVNFSDYESRMYFDKMLRESGLFARLEEMGIQDGDIVSLYTLEFEDQHYARRRSSRERRLFVICRLPSAFFSSRSDKAAGPRRFRRRGQGRPPRRRNSPARAASA